MSSEAHVSSMENRESRSQRRSKRKEQEEGQDIHESGRRKERSERSKERERRKYESEEDREARRARRQARREERERRHEEKEAIERKKKEDKEAAGKKRKEEKERRAAKKKEEEAKPEKKKAETESQRKVRFGRTTEKQQTEDKAAPAESKHKKESGSSAQSVDALMDMGSLGGGEKQKGVDDVIEEHKKEEAEFKRRQRHSERRYRRREQETEEERRARHERHREQREQRRQEREKRKAEKSKERAAKAVPKTGVALLEGETQQYLDSLAKREEYITVKKVKQQSKKEKKLERSRDAHRSSYDLPQKTTLYQGRVRSPEEAPEIFQSVTFTKVPLVLIPDDRPACSFWFVNPSGHYGITQRKGVSTPELTKEGKNYACSWTRVAYCVSQQTTTYSCPVRRCPTFDNVNIDVNIKLLFRIGADPTDVKNFAYLLGASRFDEFLHVSVQEAIRTLVRSSYWSEARDLFHTHPQVNAILKGLNKIFNFFGVFFEQSIITDVVFSNHELRQTLQATTGFQAKVKEHIESHDFRVKASKRMLSRHLMTLSAQHELNMRQIQHERVVLEMKRRATEVQLEEEREVALLEAHRKSEETLIRAQREVDVAKEEAQAESQADLFVGEDRSNVMKVLNEGKRAIMVSEAEANAAQLLAKAKLIDAAAEAKAKYHMRSARRHELRGKKAEMLKHMAGHRQIVISGENGDAILNELMKQGYRRTILKAST